MSLKKRYLMNLALAVMLSLSIAMPVLAVPQMPHAFYGTVSVGDEPAPNGVLISAKIGGVEYAMATTSDGKYGYSPTFKVCADDPYTPEVEGGVEGDTIVFYIEGIEVDTSTFSNGEITPLDLEIDELPAPPPAGGGGGAPPTYYTGTNLFGTEGSFPISNTGEILETIEATSADGKLTMTIPAGTMALDKDGNRLPTLTTAVDLSPPLPPEGANIIELAHDFGPDGATFNPPMTLEYTYDPAEIPEGVAEADLVLAFYNEATGLWVELPCTVDLVTHTVTASVSHFTTFAIIAGAPPPLTPPAFFLSNLTAHPAQVKPGETVTVAVHVANSGGTEGSYAVVLKINGVKEAEKSVTVAASGRQVVTFSVTKVAAGSYGVTVDGLSASFTVIPLVVVEPPAAFSVANLSIQPAEVQPKEGLAVTIEVAVANTGGSEGSHTVVLKINGVKEAERTVTLAAGVTLNVIFLVTKEAAGSYTVTVDGLSRSFTVLEPATNWTLVIVIVAAVMLIGLLSYIFILKRRRG